MVNGICLKFDVSYHAVMVLLVLEATLAFPIPQVPLFEVEIASCQRLGISKLRIFESRSLHSLQQLPATVV